ncbi:MAG: response regulator [Rikenellaceae bacterium]
MEVKDINVLVVDDDLLFCDLMTKELKFLGYNVRAVLSLDGINGVINEFNPSIMLLDVELGDKNGIEESIIVRNKYRDLPIIFISANPLDDYIEKAVSTTGTVFLKKPCTIKEICSYVNKYAVNNINISIGNCELLTDEKMLRNNITDITYNLSQREFDVLLLFVKNRGNIVSIDNIKLVINIENIDENTQIIYNIIQKLRSYIKDSKSAKIFSYKNKGYILHD